MSSYPNKCKQADGISQHFHTKSNQCMATEHFDLSAWAVALFLAATHMYDTQVYHIASYQRMPMQA